MLRKVSITTLSAALVFATTPGFACTGISLKAEDGGAIRARTLEFGFPLQSNVIVVPAGKEFTAAMPDGGKGLSYTSRYNVVGANAFGATMIIDGLNDQGLSVGLFYFPGYAQYADASKVEASRALAPQDFGLWVLGNFATVDEVKQAVQEIAMVATPFPGLGSAKGMAADVHFFVQDKSGKSIAVEPVGGTLKGARRAARRDDQRPDLRLAHDQSRQLHQSLAQGCRAGEARRYDAFRVRLRRRHARAARRLHSALALRARDHVQSVRDAEPDG